MSTFQLPLTNVPQSFQLTLAGIEYLMTCRWNDAADAGWVLDFADANTNVPIVSNIPLIVGADLLDGLDYLGFQGSLFVFTDGDQTAVPTLDSLGVESNVYFQTDVADGTG